MNLDVVLIDVLTPDGVLTSYKVTPANPASRVTVDRLSDVHPEVYGETDLDLGGTRIYNTSNCLIDKQVARLRAVEYDESKSRFSFQFEHMGVPVGPSRESHGGMYTLLLNPGWRLRDIRVVDPYDDSGKSVEEKKEFRYDVRWDTEYLTSLVEMQLRSGRGSFSFIVKGSASLVSEDSSETDYVEADEGKGNVGSLTDSYLLDDEGRELLGEDLADKVDWFELKPNIFGVGVNLNQIFRDAVKRLSRK